MVDERRDGMIFMRGLGGGENVKINEKGYCGLKVGGSIFGCKFGGGESVVARDGLVFGRWRLWGRWGFCDGCGGFRNGGTSCGAGLRGV